MNKTVKGIVLSKGNSEPNKGNDEPKVNSEEPNKESNEPTKKSNKLLKESKDPIKQNTEPVIEPIKQINDPIKQINDPIKETAKLNVPAKESDTSELLRIKELQHPKEKILFKKPTEPALETDSSSIDPSMDLSYLSLFKNPEEKTYERLVSAANQPRIIEVSLMDLDEADVESNVDEENPTESKVSALKKKFELKNMKPKVIDIKKKEREDLPLEEPIRSYDTLDRVVTSHVLHSANLLGKKEKVSGITLTEKASIENLATKDNLSDESSDFDMNIKKLENLIEDSRSSFENARRVFQKLSSEHQSVEENEGVGLRRGSGSLQKGNVENVEVKANENNSGGQENTL